MSSDTKRAYQTSGKQTVEQEMNYFLVCSTEDTAENTCPVGADYVQCSTPTELQSHERLETV